MYFKYNFFIKLYTRDVFSVAGLIIYLFNFQGTIKVIIAGR